MHITGFRWIKRTGNKLERRRWDLPTNLIRRATVFPPPRHGPRRTETASKNAKINKERYSRFDAGLNYTQGMNFIMGFILNCYSDMETTLRLFC